MEILLAIAIVAIIGLIAGLGLSTASAALEVPADETVENLRECRGWELGAPCPFNQVSIGVLLCRPPHKSAEEILRQVDEAMYADKSK